MADNVFFGPTVHALGTFPVTQQVEGAFFAVAGVVTTVVCIAKLIFDQIRKLAGSNDRDLYQTIKKDKDNIGGGLILTVFGVATFTPLLGTIANAVFWYKETHQESNHSRSFPTQSYTFRTT